jgi:hypothetical protein
VRARSETKISRGSWTAVGVGVAVVAGLVTIGAVSGDEHQSVTSAATSTTTPSTTLATSTSETPPPEPTMQQVSRGPSTLSATAADSSLAKLQTLAVKGRAPKTDYSREQFGQAWTDDVTVAGGHNGCDTRNDILRRDLTSLTMKPGSNGCAVQTGTLNDPYTNTTIAFRRGASTSSAVQIDHVVALSDAWQKGAQQLSAMERRNLANDPRNLQTTDGSANQQKGDGDAATWLPSNKSYRCVYVSRQIDVKSVYRLWVTAAEKDAMTRILTGCGATPVETSEPSETATRTATPVPTTPAPTTTRPPATQTPMDVAPPQDDSGSAYYKNCSAARAAGAAPLYQGQPGYRSALDRDGDGVACE